MIVVVNVLLQLFASFTTNEKVPEHKPDIVVCVIAGMLLYVATVEPEGAERMVILYVGDPPLVKIFTEPSHNPKHLGCFAPEKFKFKGVGS